MVRIAIFKALSAKCLIRPRLTYRSTAIEFVYSKLCQMSLGMEPIISNQVPLSMVQIPTTTCYLPYTSS